MLAAAEIDGFGFRRDVLDGREYGALVAAVTEGLAGAAATGAPVVALACFNLNGVGALLRDYWFRHRVMTS